MTKTLFHYFFRALLSPSWFRRRILFELSQRFYPEIRHRVPVGKGLSATVTHPDHWHSFEEVFFTDEYRSLWNHIQPPGRFLDLGCHAGYFTLLVYLERVSQGLSLPQALLIDGDARSEIAVEYLRKVNKWESDTIQFLHGAIAGSQTNTVSFVERDCMSSGLDRLSSRKGQIRLLPVLHEAELLDRFPPPYDLIKVDIEGSEFELLRDYPNLMRSTSALLLEWHSWHQGGGGMSQLIEMASQLGFESNPIELVPAHETQLDQLSCHCGVLLFQRTFSP